MTPSPLTAGSDEADVTIVRSDLFGELHVRSVDSLLFPTGMLGFPECRRFALLRGEREGLFWLQSMEYSTLTFLLVDPFMVVDGGYAFDVQPSQIVDLGAPSAAEIGLLAVVTLPTSSDAQPTANLQGPLVINFTSRRAKQLVSGDDQYGVRCPVDLSRLVA
jgi:flagellar assembly factor FliW